MKKISLIKKLIPTNYLEEKEKFFLNKEYNPQFVYEHDYTQDDLISYGFIKEEYLKKAQFILDKSFTGNSEEDLYKFEGRLLSQSEILTTVKEYMITNKLYEHYLIKTSPTQSSRTMMSKEALTLRTPMEYRKEGLLGMLHHELGTHAIRGVNYMSQPWHKKKDDFGFSPYLRTEEGLASLHSLLAHTNVSGFISAQSYLASSLAQKYSFAETWLKMLKYFDSEERLWSVVFRQKRGLEDTSKPGGFTKDIVYFEGLVDVYNWLEKNSFDLTKLYYGKMSYSDVDKVDKLNPGFKPQLPLFFTEDIEGYKNKILSIGEWNEL